MTIEVKDLLDILQFVGVVLVPAIVWLVVRIHRIELGMKDRIERHEAADMIENAMRGVESKIDLIIGHMIGNATKSRWRDDE